MYSAQYIRTVTFLSVSTLCLQFGCTSLDAKDGAGLSISPATIQKTIEVDQPKPEQAAKNKQMDGKGKDHGIPSVGRKKRLPKVIPGPPLVMGSLEPIVINRYIRKKRRRYQLCYSQQLQRFENLKGTIKVAFTITESGRVIGAKVASGTDLSNEAVQNCVRNVTASIVFPQPESGGMVKVTYPFRFKPN